jgi:hypothetical protein
MRPGAPIKIYKITEESKYSLTTTHEDLNLKKILYIQFFKITSVFYFYILYFVLTLQKIVTANTSPLNSYYIFLCRVSVLHAWGWPKYRPKRAAYM